MMRLIPEVLAVIAVVVYLFGAKDLAWWALAVAAVLWLDLIQEKLR